jgi:hypothetical protein
VVLVSRTRRLAPLVVVLFNNNNDDDDDDKQRYDNNDKTVNVRRIRPNVGETWERGGGG